MDEIKAPEVQGRLGLFCVGVFWGEGEAEEKQLTFRSGQKLEKLDS